MVVQRDSSEVCSIPFVFVLFLANPPPAQFLEIAPRFLATGPELLQTKTATGSH